MNTLKYVWVLFVNKIQSMPIEEKILWPPVILLAIIAVGLLSNRIYTVFFLADPFFSPWGVSGNVTEGTPVTTFVVTDPTGQKFLVIHYKGGTSTIPYIAEQNEQTQ